MFLKLLFMKEACNNSICTIRIFNGDGILPVKGEKIEVACSWFAYFYSLAVNLIFTLTESKIIQFGRILKSFPNPEKKSIFHLSEFFVDRNGRI
jgi:hypothetical protein